MIGVIARLFRFERKVHKETPYYEYYRIAEIAMIVTGLWKSRKDHSLNYFIIIPYISSFLVSSIGIILAIIENIQDIRLMTEGLLNWILLMHSLNSYLLMIYCVKMINRLLMAVESKFKNFELNMNGVESKLKSQSERLALIFIKLVTFTVFSVHVTYFISSKCYLPFSETKTLYFDIVLPFRSASLFYYYYAFTFETIVVVIEGLINISSIILAVGFVHILCYEIDIFGLIMENMSDLISQEVMYNKNSAISLSEWNLGIYRNSADTWEVINLECRDTHSRRIVKKIVDHHTYIISLMNDVQSILSFIVLDMFVTCEFMLCLCSFQIYQIYSTTSFVSLMKNICMLAALIVHEFVYFFFGQRLVSKTQDLHRSVYFCEWYNETKSFKNSMNIVHIRMNKPFTILAGKIVPVTLASFITCLKAAFSYFNLLRALSHT